MTPGGLLDICVQHDDLGATSIRVGYQLSQPERLRVSQPKLRKAIGALERSGD